MLSDLSGRAVGGIGPVVELSVELPRVEVQDELLQLPRDAEREQTSWSSPEPSHAHILGTQGKEPDIPKVQP